MDKTHVRNLPRVQMFTQKFTCSNLFRGSYFRVLVVGRENRENLDLAKIFRYTVPENELSFDIKPF